MTNKNIIVDAVKGSPFRVIADHLFNSYLLPLFITLVTFVSGWATNVPWFYIWIGVLVSLSCGFVSLVNYTQWNLQRRVEDKLALAKIGLAIDTKTNGFMVQLILNNAASFPIDFRVTKMDYRMDHRVPQIQFSPSTITIPSYGNGWKYSEGIVLTKPAESDFITGELDYVIQYGKAENLKYLISGHKNLYLFFNNNGEATHLTWNDKVNIS